MKELSASYILIHTALCNHIRILLSACRIYWSKKILLFYIYFFYKTAFILTPTIVGWGRVKATNENFCWSTKRLFNQRKNAKYAINQNRCSSTFIDSKAWLTYILASIKVLSMGTGHQIVASLHCIVIHRKYNTLLYPWMTMLTLSSTPEWPC